MMKKVFAFVLVIMVLTCFVGCGGDANQTTTTTETVTTTLSTADNNRIVLARLGFEELVSYLNICAAYGVDIEVGENDTIEDVIARIQDMGGEVAANNVLRTKKFFDYAQNNPDVANGTGVYIVRDNADWLALYVD